ncbi:hypothetical protein [Acinetobacter beijerinckii]|uniref:hypothetical protein n=1 Tax=Acinetobacter beijerinckii TaxID=262668 RepID=UPI003009BD71
MNAIKFMKEHGVEKAREVVAKDKFVADLCLITPSGNLIYYKEVKGSFPEVTDFGRVELTADDYLMFDLSDLKRLVESWELVESVGGLEIAKKITFQKRLRNEKATHFIQHTENQKLIQLISRNQKKPESSIEFERFEQAIADYESIYGGEHV